MNDIPPDLLHAPTIGAYRRRTTDMAADAAITAHEQAQIRALIADWHNRDHERRDTALQLCWIAAAVHHGHLDPLTAQLAAHWLHDLANELESHAACHRNPYHDHDQDTA